MPSNIPSSANIAEADSSLAWPIIVTESPITQTLNSVLIGSYEYAEIVVPPFANVLKSHCQVGGMYHIFEAMFDLLKDITCQYR